MSIGFFNVIQLNHSRILLALLLVFCHQINAQGVENIDFDAFVEKVEKLKDINPSEAFTHLQKQAANLSKLSIENQLIYSKLLAEIYLEQAQYQKSREVATSALERARRLSSPSIITSELLYARGFSRESLGDYKLAREDYRNGLEIADSLNDKKIVAVGLINIGALDYLMEKFDRALIMFNDALIIAQQLEDDELSGFIYGELGILYSLINQKDKSLAYYQKAYEHYLKSGKIFYAYNTLRNIAANHSVDERYEQAITLYKEVIEHAEQISNDELLASAYSGMAWAQIKQKNSDPEASYQYMLIAGQYAKNAQQADFPITHALDRSFLFMELQRFDDALESMNTASEILKEYENSDKKVVTSFSKLNVLYLKSELNFKLGNFKKAYQAQIEFLDFVHALPDKSNVDEVEDLRMRYESEQADLQNKILAQRESVQSLLLSETQSNVKDRQVFISIFAVFSLILAWLLIKTVNGQRKLLKISRTDSLTGIANRRWIMHLGKVFFRNAKQKNQQLSVLMIDVDDFKKVNDKYGHETGDQTLKELTSIVESNCDDKNILGRFGGEEFVLLLPNYSREQAITIAEKIRTAVFESQWRTSGFEKVSLSIGVATYSKNIKSFDELLKQADKFLYQAKHQGKNSVISGG